MSVSYLTIKATVLDAAVPELAHNSFSSLLPFPTPSL